MKSETWKSVSVHSIATAEAENKSGGNASDKSCSHKLSKKEENVRQEGAWALRGQFRYVFLWVHPSA